MLIHYEAGSLHNNFFPEILVEGQGPSTYNELASLRIHVLNKICCFPVTIPVHVNIICYSCNHKITAQASPCCIGSSHIGLQLMDLQLLST